MSEILDHIRPLLSPIPNSNSEKSATDTIVDITTKNFRLNSALIQ